MAKRIWKKIISVAMSFVLACALVPAVAFAGESNSGVGVNSATEQDMTLLNQEALSLLESDGKKVISVSLGDYHSAAIKEDGSLWTWGRNDCGQLGDGTTADKTTLVKIMDNVVSVSLGGYHSAAIKEDGSLWTWGNNSSGQLGDGTKANKTIPIKVMDGVSSVSLGGYHSAAIKEDGSLWIWGENGAGQLGDDTTVHKSIPFKIMEDVTSVSLGHAHSAAIKEDGSLWTWGSDDYGELGRPLFAVDRFLPSEIMRGVSAVSLDSHRSAAIKEDGSLWTWGISPIGDGTTANSGTPTKIMDGVTFVEAGGLDWAAIKEDGSLWTWGGNYYGQLGDGTTQGSSVPIKIIGPLSEGEPEEEPAATTATVYFSSTVGVGKDAEGFDGEDVYAGVKWVDRSVEVPWSDALFEEPATSYNNNLAQLGIALSQVTYAEGRYVNAAGAHVITGVKDGRTEQVEYLSDGILSYDPVEDGSYIFKTLWGGGSGYLGMGFAFSDIENYYYRDEQRKADNDTCCYTLAVKEVEKAGKTVPLVMVLIRGTGGNAEWISNLNVADVAKKKDDYHEGFLLAAAEIQSNIREMLNERSIDANEALFFVTGHSRGAAVANIVAASLSSSEGAQERVYAYTFAAPNCAADYQVEETNYENIFNILNPEDLVPKVPLTDWGYSRYGIDLILPSKSNASDYSARVADMREHFALFTNGEAYENYAIGTLGASVAETAVYAVCSSVENYYDALFGLIENDNISLLSLNRIVKSFMEAKYVNGGETTETFLYKAFALDAIRAALGKIYTITGFMPTVALTATGVAVATVVSPRVAHAHTPETYLSWAMEIESEEDYADAYKSISVKCPVNVYVWNEAGDLVAKIENDIVDETIMATGLAAFVDENGLKTVDIPNDGTYRVEIVATDEGEMDYIVDELNAAGSVTKRSSFLDIPLQAEQTFTGRVAEGSDNEPDSYALATQDKETELTASYAGGSAKKALISISVDGDGNAWGSASALPGTTITVTAEAIEGSSFTGWYEGGRLVSEDAAYTFRIEANRSLVAKFEVEGDSETSGSDQGTTPMPNPDPSVPTAPSTPEGKPEPDPWFSDVTDPNAWYYDAVRYAARNNLMTGYGDSDKFGPDDALTRAQAATVLWRYYAPEVVASYDATTAMNETGMPDVKDGTWYTGAANWAVENGVFNGIKTNGGRIFAPDEEITREQLCVVMANAARAFHGAWIEDANCAKFDGMPDKGKVSSWAVESVIWCLDESVINGVKLTNGGRALSPLSSVTRAMMATVVMNAIENGVI